MNALLLCAAILCSTLVFTYAQDPADDNLAAMEKRFRNFAFAKRFDTLGHNFAFAKRSAGDDLDLAEEQLTEPEKRARFAFAKRARFAFAKRARFAFA